MSESRTEIAVGGVVMAVAAAFLVYAMNTTGVSGRSVADYPLSASFRSADGVTVGTEVRLAGVKVGRVTGVTLDPETFRANTTFTVQSDIQLPDDSAVSISSEGLLGGNYVELLPGGSPFFFEAGDEVEFTQGSVSLIGLLMKFIGSSATGEDAAAGDKS